MKPLAVPLFSPNLCVVGPTRTHFGVTVPLIQWKHRFVQRVRQAVLRDERSVMTPMKRRTTGHLFLHFPVHIFFANYQFLNTVPLYFYVAFFPVSPGSYASLLYQKGHLYNFYVKKFEVHTTLTNNTKFNLQFWKFTARLLIRMRKANKPVLCLPLQCLKS
jgi:hypothetical protein